MKNILIVDDDRNFLLSLADMFKPYKDRYKIITALNGKEAIDVLARENQLDLLVTDLKMPEMDGFGLLAYMTSHHPATPVIVMTAFSSAETSDRLDAFGIFQYVEKPIEFDQLTEKIRATLQSSSKGHIAGVSLSSFLQLLGLDNKTCSLKVSSGKLVGVLYFRQGELFDAFTGSLRGLDAALEIVAWEPVEIEIEDYCRKDKRIIEEPLGFILIEGARRRDERAEAAAASPPEAEIDEDEDIIGDIDFDASAPPPDIDIIEEAAVLTGGESKPKEHRAAEMLITSVESLGGLLRIVILRRDGEVLATRNADNQFGSFVCKTALEAWGLGKALNLDDPQYIAFSLLADQKVLILFGPDVILGLEIKSETPPATIKANLAPILRRSKFD